MHKAIYSDLGLWYLVILPWLLEVFMKEVAWQGCNIKNGCSGQGDGSVSKLATEAHRPKFGPQNSHMKSQV